MCFPVRTSGKAMHFKACGLGKKDSERGHFRPKSRPFSLPATAFEALGEPFLRGYPPMVLFQQIGDRLLHEILQAHLAVGRQYFQRLEGGGIDVHHLAHATPPARGPLSRRSLHHPACLATMRARSSACATGDFDFLVRLSAPASKAVITASWT